MLLNCLKYSLFALVFAAEAVIAAPLSDERADSVVQFSETDSAAITPKRSFVKKVLNYVAPPDINTAVPKEDKFAFIGGPFYRSDSKLGIGLVGSSTFRLRGCESIDQPSVVSMTSNFSTKGFVDIALRTNLHFKADAMRLNSEAVFEYSPTYFWGMGFKNNKQDELETPMTTYQTRVDAHFLFLLTRGLYFGPSAKWLNSKMRDMKRPELLEGQSDNINSLSFGVSLDYDTRDNVTAPSRGLYVHASALWAPKAKMNDCHYWNTQLRFNTYFRVWRGGVLAGDLRAIFNFGDTSWATMALLGDSHVMRGYYPGRYRDRHLVAAQIELRQKVWKWLGFTVWGGAGSVFHDKESVHVLPNAGIGLRWEFRKNVNIRVDFGVGRAGETGFIFNINEAF